MMTSYWIVATVAMEQSDRIEAAILHHQPLKPTPAKKADEVSFPGTQMTKSGGPGNQAQTTDCRVNHYCCHHQILL